MSAALLATVTGCAGQPVDPLACELPDGVEPRSVEVRPFAEVEFSAEWGTAPKRLRVRALHAEPDRFAILGCGLDESGREWELEATWTRLPVPPAYPLDIEFSGAQAPEGTEPGFIGSLVQCNEAGCVAVDHIAFARMGNNNVNGSTHIESYDAASGRFVGNVLAEPGEPIVQPPTRLRFDLSWDPSVLESNSGD